VKTISSTHCSTVPSSTTAFATTSSPVSLTTAAASAFFPFGEKSTKVKVILDRKNNFDKVEAGFFTLSGGPAGPPPASSYFF
jgi:lipid-binding SYLF domain-containing protein